MRLLFNDHEIKLDSDMRIWRLRVPAIALVMVLFSMAACELLQAASRLDDVPSCHAKSTSEPAPNQQHHSAMKHCCEAGLIPNTNKITVIDNATINKIEVNQISLSSNYPSTDIIPLFYPPGPAKISLLSVLRI